ncbi:peptidase M16 domain-containing protein [Cyclospora cayetanensis]|uniref:Delta-aminolevulinic acid dehydratase n=1 Tax=Cyclospora cayetanensis TaxID=88456 RepID=A0A1D3CYR9_9EIME|nr:peptidase M16 domain-containing protein [Cyclospora cayetanensis]
MRHSLCAAALAALLGLVGTSSAMIRRQNCAHAPSLRSSSAGCTVANESSPNVLTLAFVGGLRAPNSLHTEEIASQGKRIPTSTPVKPSYRLRSSSITQAKDFASGEAQRNSKLDLARMLDIHHTEHARQGGGEADDEYDPIAPRGPLENNNYGEVWLPVQSRPRRNRKNHATRRLVQESLVKPSSLIYPLFVHDEERSVPIPSLPGQRRLSPADLLKEVDEARRYGVNAFMLFPKVDDDLKSPLAEESYNPDGLMPRVIMAVKDAFPDALVLADVALDPYSTSGQDGVVDEETGAVLNDMTVYQICKQSVNLARAGADMVCPSEMMDGRVTAIREALDMEGCVDTSILSYACKYASSLYGPFRDALGSHVKGGGDKKTYQMDFSNAREAEREADLDVQEGADMLMVKPGTPYLDVLHRVRQKTNVPLAAYHVSGEYAMIKAAAEKGWIDEKSVVFETLKGFRRAGADSIATYYAKDVAKWMADDCSGKRQFTEPCF